MQPEDRDPSFIFDMLDAARSAREMTRGSSLDGFSRDRKLYRAVEREIEIIGEAANQLSARLKSSHPEVPWDKIVGTRHRLAHDYAEIQLAIIFKIATVHLDELIPQLERILQTLKPKED